MNKEKVDNLNTLATIREYQYGDKVPTKEGEFIELVPGDVYECEHVGDEFEDDEFTYILNYKGKRYTVNSADLEFVTIHSLDGKNEKTLA